MKTIVESIMEAPEGNDIPDWAKEYANHHINDLPNGQYEAKRYAHMFELRDGQRYYCPIGIRRSSRMTPWEMFEVENGIIKQIKQ